MPRPSACLRLIVSLAIMTYILSVLPREELVAALRGVDLGVFGLALLCFAPTVYLAARKLQILLAGQDMRFSVRRLCAINLSSEFYGLFLPGSLAQGAVRWHKIQKDESKRVEAASVVLYNRWVESFVMSGLGLVFWSVDPLSGGRPVVAGLFAMALGGLGFLYFTLFSERGNRLLARLCALPLLDRVPSMRALALRVLASTARLGELSRASALGVVACSVANHLLGALFFALAAQSLGLSLSYGTAVWVRCGVGILAMLPVSWLEIGIRDGALIFLLAPYGVAPATAVALSMLVLAQRVIWGLSGGLVEGLRLADGPAGSGPDRQASSAGPCSTPSTPRTSPSSSPT